MSTRQPKRHECIDMAAAGGLQAALDRLGDDGGAIYVPAGVHEVNQPAFKSLKNGQSLFLFGDGRASVIVNTNQDGADLLRLEGTPDPWPRLRLTIRDIQFDGNYASGNAIVLGCFNDACVDACFFERHGAHAVVMRPTGSNGVIRDCWIRDCKRGIRAENIHHLTIHGVQTRSRLSKSDCRGKIGQTQEEHIFIDRACREVRIVNNHLAYGQKCAIILDGTAQHVISNNTIEGFAVAIDARGTDCTGGEHWPHWEHCRDIIVSNNYLHTDIGIRLAGRCTGFNIQGNNFVNNPRAAIMAEDAADGGFHNISGNIITMSVYDGKCARNASGDQGGIILGASRACVICGNLFRNIRPGPAISFSCDKGQHVMTGNRFDDGTENQNRIEAE